MSRGRLFQSRGPAAANERSLTVTSRDWRLTSAAGLNVVQHSLGYRLYYTFRIIIYHTPRQKRNSFAEVIITQQLIKNRTCNYDVRLDIPVQL